MIPGRSVASWPKSKKEQGWGEIPGTGVTLWVQGRLPRFLTSEREEDSLTGFYSTLRDRGLGQHFPTVNF